MLEAIGKYVGAKVLTALLVVGSAGAVIWFWRHPEQLEAIWRVVKLAIAWLAVALVLPWAGYPLTGWVVRRESNPLAVAMLAGYAAVDIVFALILAGGIRGHGSLVWIVMLVGFLAASVYNFMVSEYQADRIENQ